MKGQYPEVLSLGSVRNGKNGLVLYGENQGDFSGFALGGGDYNCDGKPDLLIGAYGYNGQTGRVYVVFGGKKIGSEGYFFLSQLNQTTGVIFDGEAPGAMTGIAVNDAGNVNGDDCDDFIIGASQLNNNIGMSYVVFGSPQIERLGIFNLGTLNGTYGFKILGETPGGYSGSDVSSAGDVNGDEFSDLFIGAYGADNDGGRSYVIFGGPNVGRNGLVSLGNLTSADGFKIVSIAGNPDYNGWALGFGNFNGDAFGDLLIGRYACDNWAGCTSIVYGKFALAEGGIFNLTQLNGTNGFTSDGQFPNDNSGGDVTGAGDVNQDGCDDLMIGAPRFGVTQGRAYLIFGGRTLNSRLNLSSLDGFNGFYLDGEVSPGDLTYTGTRLGTVDFNGDGTLDLLVSADGFDVGGNSNTGRTYIVFRESLIPGQVNVPLGGLNGKNGFKLDGENPGDRSGFPVVSIGDFNGDGIADIGIGASNCNTGSGCTYVVFGDAAPTLTENRLSLEAGGKKLISADDLSAYALNHDNGTLLYTVTDLAHGYFESLLNPGVPLFNFTQQAMLNNTIQFVHNGTLAPAYNITVTTSGIGWVGPAAAKITFSHFLIGNNQLVINQGETLTFTSQDNLNATYLGNADPDLIFLISNVVNGQFEFSTASNQPIFSFTRQNITDQLVKFKHYNTLNAPNYQVTVTDGRADRSIPRAGC